MIPFISGKGDLEWSTAALKLLFSFLNVNGSQVEGLGTAAVSFLNLSKQMLDQRTEPERGGSCRDVLLANVSRETDVFLTTPLNYNKKIVNLKI